MTQVLVIGVAVVDFVFALDQLPDRAMKYRAKTAEIVGGGCGASAAVAIARLGGNAILGARLGDDVIGDLILRDLESEGVDLSWMQITKGAASSFSSVYVDQSGERQIVNLRGSGLIESTDWIDNAPRSDVVLADTRWSEGAIRALELAQRWNVPGVVDAEAPMDEEVLRLASHVAFSRDGLLSFSSAKDLQSALTDADRRLPGWVCVTDGQNGTYHIENGTISQVPAFRVIIKDTLGAGDVWHGAFTLALADGQNEPEAMRYANAAAAMKCASFGGRKGCPYKDELARFLKENTV